MGFNYHSKHKNENESFWTSNSDLFLGLSSIFLLLYVVASLRTGTDGIKHSTDNKKLKVEILDLKNQLKTYEEMKENYIKTQAQKSEVNEYNELMDKLTLLQDEAKTEKNQLRQSALENENKEKALNKYQQMIRNIINANSVSKVKITNRNTIITEKENVIDVQDGQISEQKQKITSLNKNINTMESQIKDKEQEIESVGQQLKNRMSALKAAYKHQKMNQKLYNERLKKMKIEADNQLAQLENEKATVAQNLNSVQKNLHQLNSKLAQTESQLAQTESDLQQKGSEVVGLNNKLVQTQSEANAKMQGLRAAFEKQKAAERAAFEGELGRQKNLSRAEIAAKEAAFKAAADAKERKLAGELAGLGDQLKETQGKLSRAGAEAEAKVQGLRAGFEKQKAAERAAFEAELGRQKNLSRAEIAAREAAFKAASDAKERKLAGEMAGLSGQLKETQGKLADANAELEARKSIASEIKKGFAAAGVKADIDMESGDVVLNFGQTYFDNDSSNLKNEMKSTLQKAMPTYAKSLFGNPKIASQISAVEVIGFASPTYAGKIVDPYSTKPQDREALKYNMDLSYKRAKSIFNYILDEREMNFSHRDTLVPALKVSGRSFLDLMKVDRNIATVQEYCVKYDCKKSQRVIIKFNMNKK